MAWLEKLDAKSRQWPALVRWLYVCLKWYLVISGAVVIIGLALTELSERRVGLGTGVVTVCAFSVIKSIIDALTGWAKRPAPPHHP